MTDPTPAPHPTLVHLMRRGAVCTGVVATLLAGAPGTAFAHGVSSAGTSVSDFVWSGFTHMILGWDHLLFIAGVVLLAGPVKRSATLITLFALGHSTTLVIATLAGWPFSTTAVDIVIALSVVFVGVAGFVDLTGYRSWFAAYVCGFGLVHGLGLATRLQPLLPHDGQLTRVIAFNIGVEVGQLLAILGMYLLGDVLRHHITWPRRRLLAHAGLIAAGLTATTLLTLSALTTPATDRPAAANQQAPPPAAQRN